MLLRPNQKTPPVYLHKAFPSLLEPDRSPRPIYAGKTIAPAMTL